jgi:hypothetical protein
MEEKIMASVLCQEVSIPQRVIRACAPNLMENRRGLNCDCATCEIRDGVPTTSGWGYYASENGKRMLVVERKLDQRIRINGEIEIVVLELSNGRVRLAVESATASKARDLG